jgi:hypothetical protein
MATLAGLRSQVARIRQQAARTASGTKEPVLARLRADPTLAMTAMGLNPDPWQRELITCRARQIAVLCTRRAGKSQGVAARALVRCLTSKCYTLVFSPTGDQSKEFLGLAREMNDALGCPVPLVRESLSELAWANGSRLKAKPDSPRGSRGPTPDLVIIDEGAQASDELYMSLKPMMVLGKAEMIILSTPFGKLGWFFDIWNDPAKLEEHRLTMPPRWFAQEYLCEFNDAVDAVFTLQAIHAAERADDLFLPLAM